MAGKCTRAPVSPGQASIHARSQRPRLAICPMAHPLADQLACLDRARPTYLQQAASRKPQAASRKPQAASRKPKAESRKPKAESRKPKAESRKPKAESRKPKADCRLPIADCRLPIADCRLPPRLSLAIRAAPHPIPIGQALPLSSIQTTRTAPFIHTPRGSHKKSPGANAHGASRNQVRPQAAPGENQFTLLFLLAANRHFYPAIWLQAVDQLCF